MHYGRIFHQSCCVSCVIFERGGGERTDRKRKKALSPAPRVSRNMVRALSPAARGAARPS